MIISYKNSITVIIVMVFFILDRSLKYFLVNNILEEKYSFINLIKNKGIAFGITIPSQFNFIFYLLLIIIFLILIHWLIISSSRRQYLKTFSLFLILAGAASNMIDRIRCRAVIDFIDLKFWPIFNIADIMIVVGVLIIITTTLKIRKHKNI